MQVGQEQRRGSHLVLLMMVVAAGGLLACGMVRHNLCRSGAFDLGFFDQAVYLISIGQTPISSLNQHHVLADHASLILYPLALLYRLWANPMMLLAAQAAALAAGAWPVWRLGLRAGLSAERAAGVSAAYLLYPLVFTASLFDFHPDAFVVPALLWAILAVYERRPVRFAIGLAVALSCKEIMGLTVFAMGVWLLLGERRRAYGISAMVAGAVWFAFSTKLLIPYMGDGRSPSGLGYYSYLGSTLGEVVTGLFTRPGAVASHLLSPAAGAYLLILLLPLVWALDRRHLWPLLGAVPAVMLNLLSDNPSQRSPFYQYSLPALPFLMVAAVGGLAAGRAWLQRPRAVVLWSLAMLAVGGILRADKVATDQVFDWDALKHSREALNRIQDAGDVLTTFELVPHLSRREVVQYIGGVTPLREIHDYEYVLLNVKHQSLAEHEGTVQRVLMEVATSPLFEQVYSGGDVYLYRRGLLGGVAQLASWREP